MAQLKCPCGTQLSNNTSPNEIEGLLITEHYLENNWQESITHIPHHARPVWECPTCGRLAFNFPGRKDCTVKWYVPENRKPGALMAFEPPKSRPV